MYGSDFGLPWNNLKMGKTHNKHLNTQTPLNFSFKFMPYKLNFVPPEARCQWKQLSSNCYGRAAPKPRSGHRIVCNDTNMYSFGGYNPSLNPSDEMDLVQDNVWGESKPLFKELWKFNIATSSWKKLAVDGISDILASNAVILSGNLLMVYGGTGVPFGLNCSNNLYVCDIQNDLTKFNLISTTGNCPQPQYGQAIVLINNYLYTVGGTTGFQYTCDIHRLNIRDRVWEEVYICNGTPNEPPGRYRHEVAFDGDKIYVLGGGTSNVAFDFKIIFAFNLSTCEWDRISARPDDKVSEAYPAPRRCHSCVQFEGHAYIIGGYNGRMMFSDIWKLNLKTFEWMKLKSLSLDKGTYFHSSCITSAGKLITFGGIIPTDNSSTRSSAVYTAWLCIPKLKDLCWEAVMYYYPKLKSLSEEELIMAGLPSEYISKLDLPQFKKRDQQVI